MSKIEWTEQTWNPTTGCDRVSEGCDHCYALTMAGRLKAMGQEKYQTDGNPQTSGPGFGVAVHPETLDAPLRWRKPRHVFVDSMGDLFHDAVPDEFIARVFAVMAATPQHTYQVLTKRPGRMRALVGRNEYESCSNLLDACVDEETALALYEADWPLPNVWLGVSAENQKWADVRIPVLLDTNAAVRFVSAEPILGPIDLLGDAEQPGPAVVRTGFEIRTDYGTGVEHDVDDQIGIDWVIVGGESGPDARPMELRWVRDLRDQCQTAGVPLFVKQLGSCWAAQNGQRDKGGDISLWPADLRVRELPHAAKSTALETATTAAGR